MSKDEIRSDLYRQLIEENALWSYGPMCNIPDELLIEKVLVYLDIPQIDSLFHVFSYRKVKSVWRERLVPRDDYYHTLNRFFAWYYFHAKNPDSYLKSLQTRFCNKTIA